METSTVQGLGQTLHTNSHITVLEVGPRDGLQNEERVLSPDDRIALIERCAAAGARRIEAVSFVHPGRVPQMAGAEEVMKGVPRGAGVSYSGLVLNRRGLDRALAAGVDEVNVVVVASDTFCRRNQGCTTDEALAAWDVIAAAAHDAGVPAGMTIAAAFGCPFEGETPPERVAEIARRAEAAGAFEVALADTIGVGVPAQVRDLARRTRAAASSAALRFHFHNTRNTGYANALTAVEEGAAVLDASAGGFGGCPFAPAATGNIATEDLLYALERSGVGTGMDMAAIAETGTWLGTLLGKPAPALLGRAGPFPS
ncbi:hydroxymethylglutaryl-CoA lyase [Actinocorallia longicatena]|uniref:Hydroxymethylglutaryl-CoA lyase n=1 Tax=Actinocorallia longicatena TaxID=111803 RepID=A0ABP6Q8P0_9ACTN